MITIYHKDGSKTVTDKGKIKESYAAISEKPMSQRVLDAYYSLECQQKPLGIKNASRVKAIHMAALAEGR
jgi:hypothetical protein